MAYLHEGIEYHPEIGSSRVVALCLNILRWTAIPCVGIAVTLWSATTLASLHSAASLARQGTFMQASLPLQPKLSNKKSGTLPSGKTALTATAGPSQSLAHFSAKLAVQPVLDVPAIQADPFAKVIAEAKLSREKLLTAFAGAGMKIASLEETSITVALAMPSAERFHGKIEKAPLQPQVDPLSTVALGHTGLTAGLDYVSVEAGSTDLVQLALASIDLDPLGLGPDVGSVDEADSIDLPPAKPISKRASKDVKPSRQPATVAEEPAAPGRKPGKSDRQEAQQALAYARPDKPAIGAFKNLFNTPKAGNKVAIYDISAAVVHMPDGTRLEAHSGIGKMADNPRYVHVKMNGPTPPNTYKLSMREKRFHGVEAVRMTPIGDETMHGRDGILAHSYLLRGGRAESHGCVAFKDYNRFLKAFKQGKITHIVVVPSLSKAPKIRLASNGRDT